MRAARLEQQGGTADEGMLAVDLMHGAAVKSAYILLELTEPQVCGYAGLFSVIICIVM